MIKFATRKNQHGAVIIAVVFAALLSLLLPGAVKAAMAFSPDSAQQLSDEQMSAITGQALFVSDRIAPSGAGTGATASDFTFYRMGLDVDLALNANIDKLQLGCGGFNEATAANSCDIDFDFVRFMGRNGAQPGAPVTSDFVLTRPYIELAIVNDGTTSQREVVGVKIGSQQADGFVSVGRDYLNANATPSGQTNQEHGGTCNATQGPGALACHSGVNRISGNLRSELSGALNVTITLSGTSQTCFGRTNLRGNLCSNNDPLFVDIRGTRLNILDIPLIELNISGGLAGLISGSAYANVRVNTRFVHGFALENTSDFFISFQRQQVAYPDFPGTGYSAPANAGWWMNVPLVKILDVEAAPQSFGLFEGLSGLSPPGIALTDVDFRQRAASNCYGGLMFC